MTLGLPPHLASSTLRGSFSRAVHAIAYTCLGGSLLLTVAFQWASPTLMLWPAILPILLMAGFLALSDHFNTTFFSVAYLAIGGASAYWCVVTFYSQRLVSDVAILGSDAFPLALLKIAVIMVGGTGRTLVSRILWSVAGYLVAEFAVFAAAVVTQITPPPFDFASLLSLLTIIAIFIFATLSRRTSRRTQPMLHRAARDEKLASMRFRLEVKAAALMHDTVLSHLAAIADSTDRQLDPTLADRVQLDLATLVGEEWLTDDTPEVDYRASADWRQSELFAVVTQSQALGLEIECTGDLNSVARLPREPAGELALAVKQCLVNVLLHSGVTRAEIAIFGSDLEVSVMVIDAGRGFSEAETSPDRLGLRQSVRQRMEAVGGSVQVWSTLGRGTSIMIRVPTLAASATGLRQSK